MDQRCHEEQARGGHTGENSLSGCRRSHEDCPQVQRNGQKGRGWSGHARSRSPRYRWNRFSVPGDGKHKGRQQYYGRYGYPVFCRQRGPWHEPRRPAQWRRRGHRQGYQRGVRAGAGRKRSGRRGHSPGYPVGCNGGCCTSSLGTERTVD